MKLLAWIAAAAAALSLLGCRSSDGSRSDAGGDTSGGTELVTYTQWSEGTDRLYVVLGAGWPPTGLREAAWQDTTGYRARPPLAIRRARMLADGLTVCLDTGEQAAGATYQVRYAPRVPLASPPLEGYPQSWVLTAVAVDSTHIVALPERHHLTWEVNWGAAATYHLDPPLPIVAAEASADGRVVRLTTAEQDLATDYRLVVGGESTPVVR